MNNNRLLNLNNNNLLCMINLNYDSNTKSVFNKLSKLIISANNKLDDIELLVEKLNKSDK